MAETESSKPDKWVCDVFWCANICTDAEVLWADDPFNPGEKITACPKCRQIGTLVGACDFDGCKSAATSGTPTASGYVSRCYDHRPDRIGGGHHG